MSTSSMERPCALPDALIDRLFDRMEAAYGSKWANMWGNTNLRNVKALWAEKLAGFSVNPKAIKYALDALDEHPYPPTLPEFLALCRKAPRLQVEALPAPAADKQKINAAAKEAKRATGGKQDLLGWAKRPRSCAAFQAVADLAKKGDRAFADMIEELQSAGHVKDGRLIDRWDGSAWVRV